MKVVEVDRRHFVVALDFGELGLMADSARHLLEWSATASASDFDPATREDLERFHRDVLAAIRLFDHPEEQPDSDRTS